MTTGHCTDSYLNSERSSFLLTLSSLPLQSFQWTKLPSFSCHCFEALCYLETISFFMLNLTNILKSSCSFSITHTVKILMFVLASFYLIFCSSTYDGVPKVSFQPVPKKHAASLIFALLHY